MTKTKPASNNQADVLARVMNNEQRKTYGKLMVNDATINLEYAERMVKALNRAGYQITKRSEFRLTPTTDGGLVCLSCGKRVP